MRATTSVFVRTCLEYDQVNNEQREIIYAERRQVLDGENMRDAIYKMITDIVDNTVDMCFSDDVDSAESGIWLSSIPLLLPDHSDQSTDRRWMTSGRRERRDQTR